MNWVQKAKDVLGSRGYSKADGSSDNKIYTDDQDRYNEFLRRARVLGIDMEKDALGADPIPQKEIEFTDTEVNELETLVKQTRGAEQK